MRFLIFLIFIFVGHVFAGKDALIRRNFVDLTTLNRVVDPHWEEAIGHHLIVDLFGCNPKTLVGLEQVKAVMLDAARAAGATIVDEKFHQFSPVGVTGVLVLAESHLAVHTWPEKGYCAIDLFTCGKINNPAALETLKAGFEATECVAVEINRGKLAGGKIMPTSRL